MAEHVLAVFNTPAEAVRAAAELRREGVPRSRITMMSAEPIHSWPAEHDELPKSRVGLFSIAGAIFGAGAALLLTIWTSRGVNLNTGGLPIVTWWAFGIIVFELTALGAILFTLASTIVEARLARRGALANYDEAVADGKVVIDVECADEAERDIAERVIKQG
jgi:hypothetical protein